MLVFTRLKSIYDDPKAKYFLSGMFIYGIAQGLYNGSLNNYLYEILTISKVERGIVEFPRELPGFLLFGIMAVFYRFTEQKIMRIALILSFFAAAALGFIGTSKVFGIILIVLWSTGDHMLMPIRDSVGMHMAKPGKAGLAMGGVTSMGNFGQVIGYYAVPLLFLVLSAIAPRAIQFVKYRTVFFLCGGILVVAIAVTSIVREKGTTIQRERLYFRKKYTRYYILEVFNGARKQVFLTFAPYVLITQYNAKTEYVSILYGIWCTINIFFSPVVGKLIDRFGYRKIIVTDTIVVTFLCIMYGFSHRVFGHAVSFYIISGVFILDAIMFTFSMARSMYTKSISDSQEEVTATLSTGISINHSISIIIAILGGLLWEKLGIEMLFSMAAIFGLGSFIFALALPRQHIKIKEPQA